MTLDQHIAQLNTFADRNAGAGNLQVVFHDVDGGAIERVDICLDGTCSEEEPEVVRISHIDEELEASLVDRS